MMSVAASRHRSRPGGVVPRLEYGMMVHELVYSCSHGWAGTRVVGTDGRVSEAGSLGRRRGPAAKVPGTASPGAASWVTLHLDPGRYELICNLPGHYAMGMFAELDVA